MESIITIDALTNQIPFRTINEHGGTETIGELAYVDYEKDRLIRRMYFVDQEEQIFPLGHTSRKEKVILDHVDVLEPLLDTGFEVSTLTRGRGGAKLLAILHHPEISIPDEITWDKEFLPNVSDSLEMNLSIGVWFDGRIGKAIKAIAGYFRWICANGLVDTHLGLGTHKVSPSQFSALEMEKFGFEVQDLNLDRVFPEVSVRAMNWCLKTLELAYEDSTYLSTLPDFVSAPLSTLLNQLPKWATEGLLFQLNLLAENKDMISTLDIVNAITNVQRLREGDRIYQRLGTLTSALTKSLDIGAFKMDVPSPRWINLN